jgi:glutamine amidotransferase
MIAIIDYGLGNIGSIEKIINYVGYDVLRVSKPEDLKNIKLLILPGVGSFDNGISLIDSLNLRDALNELVLIKKIPILGICLGMQLMCNNSEEGSLKGLGWIDAEVIKFNLIKNKVPHMGWNFVNPSKKNSFYQIDTQDKFYFVHSYYVKCKRQEDVSSITNYEINFTSSFNKDNIYGVQFHPEKSHIHGINFFKNFLLSRINEI